MGLIHGLGRFRMLQSNLSLCSAVTEPAPQLMKPTYCYYWACTLLLLKPVYVECALHQERTCNEKPAHCSEEWARSLQLEKTPGSKEILAQPQEKFKKILKGEIWKNYLVIQPCHIFIYWKQWIRKALSWVVQYMRKNQDFTSKGFML